MLVDLESESLLLSAFLRFPQKVGSQCVESQVSSDYLSSSENSTLYRFLLGVWSSGEHIDQHRISFGLKKEGLLSSVGGAERLQFLSTLCPSVELVPQLIETIKDLHHRRNIRSACQSAATALDSDAETKDVASLLTRALEKHEGDLEVKTPTPKELSDALIAHAERASVVPTGFTGIDQECGSLYLGDLLVVAGGAKAGKSTLAANIAEHISRTRFVVVFTIEMNRVEFWKRIVNAKAGVSTTYWHPTGPVSPFQNGKVHSAINSLSNNKITIVDQVSCIDHAFSICRALKAKHGELGAVVIDYLQMFSTPEKTSTRAEAVSAISRSCKRAATALQTLVIGVSQLNDDGKSLESRGIQRDANLMLNVLVDEHGNRSVVSAFNRNGPMGIVLPIKAELQFNRFVDGAP